MYVSCKYSFTNKRGRNQHVNKSHNINEPASSIENERHENDELPKHPVESNDIAETEVVNLLDTVKEDESNE